MGLTSTRGECLFLLINLLFVCTQATKESRVIEKKDHMHANVRSEQKKHKNAAQRTGSRKRNISKMMEDMNHRIPSFLLLMTLPPLSPMFVVHSVARPPVRHHPCQSLPRPASPPLSSPSSLVLHYPHCSLSFASFLFPPLFFVASSFSAASAVEGQGEMDREMGWC